jgi:hypothetical protein
VRVNPANRKPPGTKPAGRVIHAPGSGGPPPDDWRCTWPVRLDPETGKPYWELKFIHAGCPRHARLKAA